MESRFNASSGKYTMLELPGRIAERPLPKVHIVDMRQEFLETRKHNTFSRALIEAIRERLSNNEQAMVLLNRRGFSSFVACRSCGTRVECINCALTLTWHRRDRRLLCHFCGYAEKVPTVCPKCQSEHIHFMGVGSERVEDELHGEFPEAKIARLDRDTVTGKRQFEDILNNFRERNFDILVGTQMIAKGHDVHGITLVGVVGCDHALSMPDFRAAERVFQLMTQVSGRAGRGELPGRVVVQTYYPDHYAILAASKHDYASFVERELKYRRWMHYPPFGVLANVLVQSEKPEEAAGWSSILGKYLIQNENSGAVRVLGPCTAPIARIKGIYRFHMILKAGSRKALNAALRGMLGHAEQAGVPRRNLIVDVDALRLM
jgi:primosomal protein N' (replication factor Y)